MNAFYDLFIQHFSILLPFFRLIYDVFDFLLFSGIILFSSLHCCGLKVSYEMLLLISSTILAHSINVWRAFDRKIYNKTEQNCCGTNPHLWLSTCAFCNPITLNLIMKFNGLVALLDRSYNSIKFLHSFIQGKLLPSTSNDKGLLR